MTDPQLQPRMWLPGHLLNDPEYRQGASEFDLVLVQPDGQELLVHTRTDEQQSRYLAKHEARQGDMLLVVGRLETDHVLSAEIICCDTSMDGDASD